MSWETAEVRESLGQCARVNSVSGIFIHLIFKLFIFLFLAQSTGNFHNIESHSELECTVHCMHVLPSTGAMKVKQDVY